MEILSAIIQLLGGLAMFLYGIEVMGDGLKNSSGDALKRVLEKVTGNVFMGVLTGALVTAVIQSSTATIVLAVALLIIFMKAGFALGMGSILIGHCTFCIPYAVVTIKGRISGDNETLEEASMDLGANRVQTFFRVTLPTIFPGVMSAAFLSFTMSFDDVVMSNMLAGARQSTLPVLILSMNKSGITPDVNALTTIMVLVIVTAMILNNIIQGSFNTKWGKN